MPKVSIIVPVYNKAQYLSQCIESILRQSFADFELLLIDDGSTDGSGAICDTYANKDNRVRVLHKENGGVSSARNVGLDNVNSEWVGFVDADDELMPDGLMTLVNGIEDDVDIIMGGYIEIGDDGSVIRETNWRKERILSKKESVKTLYLGYEDYYMGYVWCWLFKTSIIRKLDLRFDISLAIKEDTLFVMQYICKSSGIINIVENPVYKYYNRQGSVMDVVRNGGCDGKYVDSFYAFIKMKHEVEKEFPSYTEVALVAKQCMYKRYHQLIQMIGNVNETNKELIDRLRTDMKHEMGCMLFFLIRRKYRKLVKRR